MAFRRGTRARTYTRRLRAVRDRSEALMFPGVRDYLQRQADRLTVSTVRRAFRLAENIDPRELFRLADPDIGAQLHMTAMRLIPESDTGILLRVWAPGLRYSIENTSALGVDVWGIRQPGLPLLQGTAEYANIVRQSGERITNINETTRRLIRENLAEGVLRGEGGMRLAERIEQVVPEIKGRISSPARARMIARTEAAFSSAQSTVATYAAADVAEVDIVDGPDCGWETHNARPLANGLRVTLAAYEQQPLAHPNCRRGAMPVIE